MQTNENAESGPPNPERATADLPRSADPNEQHNEALALTLTSTASQALSLAGAALLPEETARLAELERVIATSFIEAGTALAEIRERGLYRATQSTFESYCQERWGIVASRARQLIGAAKAFAQLEKVLPRVTLPTSEAQVRPLVALSPEEQVAVWQEAVEAAPDGKPTRAQVERVRDRHYPKPQPIIEIEAEVVVTGSATPSATVTAPKVVPIYAKRVEGKPASQGEVEKRFEQTWKDAWIEFRDKYLKDYHSANRDQVKALIRDWMASLPTVRALVEASL